MQDKVMQQGRWTFGAEVAECFPDMLARSIPEYLTMRELVYKIGKRYVNNSGFNCLLDIGCSDGQGVERFVKEIGAKIKYTMLDISAPMVEKCKEKYSGWIDCGIMNVSQMDITKDFPKVCADLTLSVLTIQFTPIECRQEILKNIYQHTKQGGALIMVEKVIGSDAETDALLIDEYYSMKRENGYTDEQINAKRESLKGVLVPVKDEWNKELLKASGFSHIETFWRCLNFVGYLAVKG